MKQAQEIFRRFAMAVSVLAGSVGAFTLAMLVILSWALMGPAFGFSDTWQLVINTGTTIVTFLMVFLIQNTQNRESRAVHAKLDELLLKLREADNHLIEAEEMSDEELEKLRARYLRLAGSVTRPRSRPRKKS
jgi:low affinity Fe/Cu permease